jgi:hypothetical protein
VPRPHNEAPINQPSMTIICGQSVVPAAHSSARAFANAEVVGVTQVRPAVAGTRSTPREWPSATVPLGR